MGTGRVAAVAFAAVLSIGAPAAGASAQVLTPFPAGGAAGGSISAGNCTHDRYMNGAASIGGDGQGRTGGNEDVQCQGTGEQSINAGVGQQSSVVGGRVTGSTINAPIQTSAGASAAHEIP